MNLLNFFTDSKIFDDFFDGNVSLPFFIMNKLWQGDMQCFRCKFHLLQNLINVNIIRLNNISMRRVPDYILFNFTHSHHCAIQHLFHEYSLLRMDHLIIGIFKLSIGFKISQIQGSIVLKPLII